jgi:putative nucleotidyltransferase with HDIG domain
VEIVSRGRFCRYDGTSGGIFLRWVSLKYLGAHRVLAQPILDERGRILLSRGVELSPSLVRRLTQLGIHSVCVDDPITEDLFLQELVSPTLRQELVSVTYNSLIDIVGKGASRVVRPSEVQKRLKPLVTHVIGELRHLDGAGQHLGNVYLSDGELYHHSVNVALFSLTLGIHLGLEEEELIELGIGALLHDVGKLKIPGAVLRKPGRLSDDEFEVIKQHTSLGFELLREIPDITTATALIALNHHERVDGSGYPRGLKGDEIHTYGRIVSVADVYEALTANRVYRSGYLPHQAFEFLLGAGGTQFDESVVQAFVQTIAIYPVGVTLQLSNGQRCVVVRTQPRQTHRPVVRVLTDLDGQALDTPYELDLTEELTLEVVACDS